MTIPVSTPMNLLTCKRINEITMKTIFIIFAVLTAFTMKAQNYDSLKRAIHELTLEQNRVDLNMELAHEQFSTGTLVMGLGLGTGAIGALLYFLNKEDPGPVAPGMMIAGGAATVTGWIIQIDSHKWFSRKRHQN